MEPLVFTPFLRSAVWGGRRLGERLGKILPPGGPWAESWEVSAHSAHPNRVAEGPLTGSTLPELCRERPEALLGSRGNPVFPWLVKFLDVHDWVSLQVHPNDDLAIALAGEPRGKTEAWVILDAGPQSRIYSGFRPGIDRPAVEAALARGQVAEVLHGWVPRVGDCVFLPAGTVHAVGGGVLLAEVQQTSDATLRLFDWQRPGPPRPLHVEQALEAIDWHLGPVGPVQVQPWSGLPPHIGGERLVECAHFCLDRFWLQGSWPSPFPGEVSLWLVLAGTVGLSGERGYRRLCRTGETILVPAGTGPVEWISEEGAVVLAVVAPGVLTAP